MWKASGTALFDPWRDLFSIENGINEFLSGLNYRRGDFPPANVWTGDDRIEFEFEVPGIPADKLEVTAKQETLTVRGTREADPLPEGATFLRQARGEGTFARSFSLPFKVDADAVEAKYRNDILKVVLPKSKEIMPKKISVVGE